MEDSVLRTRDGRIVRPLGTWEIEELKRNPMDASETTPSGVNKRMRYIYRTTSKVKKFWIVRIVIKGTYYSSGQFHDHDYGFSKEESLKAAQAFRDTQSKLIRDKLQL